MEAEVARLAFIFALAACWTSATIEPEPPEKPRVLRPRPQCYSSAFYDQRPPHADYYETLHACQVEWDDGGQAAVCFAWRVNAAYERLDYWVSRWLEACDPSRAPKSTTGRN